MKILVTGSSGFINGYLIEDLLNNEHEVIELITILNMEKL